MLSYTIKSTRPESLNSILIMLRTWKAQQGRLGMIDEDLYCEALNRLEFLQERVNR